MARVHCHVLAGKEALLIGVWRLGSWLCLFLCLLSCLCLFLKGGIADRRGSLLCLLSRLCLFFFLSSSCLCSLLWLCLLSFWCLFFFLSWSLCLSVASSLPQPLVAVPAYLFVEWFSLLLPIGLGCAAGTMIWMVFAELIPDGALAPSHPRTLRSSPRSPRACLVVAPCTARQAAGAVLVCARGRGADGEKRDATTGESRGGEWASSVDGS